MTCVALIVAAGRGTRFGAPLPKQFASLAGRPVLSHCINIFASHQRIDATRCVIHPDDRAHYDAAAVGAVLLEPVAGGRTRQESVRLGLESLGFMQPTQVLIHDGARPFPAPALIDRVISALDTHEGAIAAVPVTDTLKREALGGVIGQTIARAGLWRAQTPQAFRYQTILDAHCAFAETEVTDDAALLEQMGLPVALVPASEENMKITTADDLDRAERLLGGSAETRVGTGFDVHRFGPGSGIRLCGVALAHDAALVGHSDADVGLHAIVDAVLGAIGAGDIGSHFPPSDARWRGADSAAFVSHAAGLVAAAGGRVGNIDVTLICERPRIGSHREAMRTTVAGLLGIGPERVSIKATTTEGLGFTGRGEGIAAQAVATVVLG